MVYIILGYTTTTIRMSQWLFSTAMYAMLYSKHNIKRPLSQRRSFYIVMGLICF